MRKSQNLGVITAVHLAGSLRTITELYLILLVRLTPVCVQISRQLISLLEAHAVGAGMSILTPREQVRGILNGCLQAPRQVSLSRTAIFIGGSHVCSFHMSYVTAEKQSGPIKRRKYGTHHCVVRVYVHAFMPVKPTRGQAMNLCVCVLSQFINR